MPRTLTEDGSGNLTFQERATDVDQDQITVEKVELDAIDGVGQTGASRTPAWLSHTTTFNSGDPSEMLIDVTLVASQLSVDTTYTFLFEVSDGIEVTQRTVDLVVKPPVLFTGDHMYLADNGKVAHYTLGTSWDISTATLSETLNISGKEGSAGAVYIRSGGSDIYVLGFDSDAINHWSLSTPFDISSATFQGSFNYSSQTTQTSALSFKHDDGSKMFIVGPNNNTMYEYILGTPWDPTTASLGDTYVNSELGSKRGTFFRINGENIYAIESNSSAEEHTLSTAWDITTATFINESVPASISGKEIFFKEDGSVVFTASDTPIVKSFSLGTNWDLSTANSTPINSFDPSSEFAGLFGMCFA